LADAQHLPQGRCRAGDRHLKFYDCRDNLGLDEAAVLLGVARQTVLHKVQRGELQAVYVNRGQRKGLRIKVSSDQAGLFEQPS